MRSNAIKEARCRDEAQKLLKSFYVGAPGEIDLDALAGICKLSIEDGGIDSCDGRLVASKGNGGVIRVVRNIRSEGRRRFTIAHEIGHYRLHDEVLAIDDQRTLEAWSGVSIETEANIFAAELLMPHFLFSLELKNQRPSWALVNRLSSRYKTSKLATAIQMIEYMHEPCALVYSSVGVTRWCKRSNDFAGMNFYVPGGQKLHEYSLAYELFSKQDAVESKRGEKTYAKAWLTGYEWNEEAEVIEDSIRYGDDIASIIFVEDDI